MTNRQFLTYQKFYNKSQATDLVELLTTNQVEFFFEDASTNFDPSFANNEISKEYIVKVQKEDFEKVDKILTDLYAKEIDSVDAAYYLFDFTNDELTDLLIKSDEWSKYDYLLAQKILEKRGIEINDDLLNTFKKQRIEDLTKPDKTQKTSIIMGYIFALLGGLIGGFIGWHLLCHKKTLPNGDRVYGYSVSDRKQGKRILILGIFFFLLWTSLRFIGN